MSNLPNEWRAARGGRDDTDEYSTGYDAALVFCTEQLEADLDPPTIYIACRGSELLPLQKMHSGEPAIFADPVDAEKCAAQFRAMFPHRTYTVRELKL